MPTAVGLFDIFSGKGGGLKRTIAKATNKDAQSVDRWKALEQLADDGSEEALGGLLRRFGFVYDKTIEDEQEKDYVFDQLRRLGPTILPELEQHMRNADSIAWGLRLLGEVANDDEAWPLLERLCEQNDNNYTRDPSKKTQLVHHLGEAKDPRASTALVPYLEDVDEGVRFNAVEGLLRHRSEATREPLLALLGNERIWPAGYSYLFFTRDAGQDTLGGTAYYYPQATRSVYATLDLRF